MARGVGYFVRGMTDEGPTYRGGIARVSATDKTPGRLQLQLVNPEDGVPRTPGSFAELKIRGH